MNMFETRKLQKGKKEGDAFCPECGYRGDILTYEGKGKIRLVSHKERYGVEFEVIAYECASCWCKFIWTIAPQEFGIPSDRWFEDVEREDYEADIAFERSDLFRHSHVEPVASEPVASEPVPLVRRAHRTRRRRHAVKR